MVGRIYNVVAAVAAHKTLHKRIIITLCTKPTTLDHRVLFKIYAFN